MTIVAGVVIVAVMAASQTGAAELTAFALDGLDAPFFLMWLHTSFMVLLLPLLVGAHGLLGLKNPPRAEWGLNRTTAFEYVKLQLIFYPLWVVANYAYVRALACAQPGVVTAVFGSCTAFVAVFSRLSALKEPLTKARVASVLLAVVGVALVGAGTDDGTSKHCLGGDSGLDSVVGVLLALLSSLAAACYKVWFKVFLGSPNPIQLSVFLFLLGAINVCLGLIPTLLLAHFGTEDRWWSPDGGHNPRWDAIMGGSVLTLSFNFSIALGIAITYPLFIAVGTVLTIPATLVVDELNGNSARSLEICGAVVIVASFVTIILVGGGGGSGGEADARSRDGSATSVPSLPLDCEKGNEIRGTEFPNGLENGSSRAEREGTAQLLQQRESTSEL